MLLQDHRGVEYASKGFRLPRGWSVEEVPRKNSHYIDKYYVERKTGKRFRSLVSVERYLRESRNSIEQQLRVLQNRRGHSKDFRLPDGWIVEEKPRRSSSHIDRSYIEPGTGNKFRSMAAVERYLISVGNITLDSVSMVHSERLPLLMNRNGIRFQSEVIDPNPPKKVKWVLTGSGGNMFTANVRGSNVSSLVKHTWSEAFVSLIEDRS
ncbi:DNA-binding domain superfamily [Arabidopsis suecica]|uniref:MBD7 n=2 Tax=Arabidopsis TaxID=3701 RepID=A0A178UMV1_ARATH|nr:DNA-binding domain superfamily [Arabidopsis suecica]OAO95158.1 MBD7 [Arabidopsis thaliana]